MVVFDEAQCLPPVYLRPIVFAIRELFRHYGVTPVLCTATQPVLTQTERFDFTFREGFEEVKEIIEDPAALSQNLQRVTLSRHNNLDAVGYEALADTLKAERQAVLCIVNTKRGCRELANLLPEDEAVHLSTNMCAAHRLSVLGQIRERLTDNAPLFVISTSLVEAGVDLDFPVVYRALAGLDSIAQAAGRCNREGTQATGRTVVFLPEDQPDYVMGAASLARGFLDEERLGCVFLPETFYEYFNERFFLLGAKALDERGILELLSGNLDFYYRTAAERFRLIDDGWQLPLIVPYGKAPEVLDKLLEWNAKRFFRMLQPYTVAVPKYVLSRLVDEDYAHELNEYPGVHCLHTRALYTDRFGFVPPDDMDAYDAAALIG